MAQKLPRIALVVHGFPPHARTGVENHVECLARALAVLDVQVEVFAACHDRTRRELDMWREEYQGYAITRVAAHRSPRDAREALDRPGMAPAFGAWLDERKIGAVHFHHVLRLGVGLIHEASRRGLPVVYTAHDFYAVSSRYTLLAPDLSAIEPGDLEAEVRADLALELLDRIERLGDHHGMALAAELEPAEREALAAILHGDPARAGVSRAKLRAAGELRRELELRRREAFRCVDLFLSPTRLVADTLARAGFSGARIEIDPYGIDLAPFAGLAPRRVASPVSFGYLGGLLKHKGVHVLLEAFAGFGGDATLDVFGDSRDRAYVELLRRRAAESGARLRGAYEVSEAARCLSEIDVLVVPSIWPENAPFVIREAFAARRPVIASRIGALAESVRDGVDGLLFDPGDARALSAVMRRVVREDGLLTKLAGAIRPVHSIQDQAGALVERYRDLVREKKGARAVALPAHLNAFASRVQSVSKLDPEELVSRVLAGLGDLGRMLCGPESSSAAHIARAWTGRGELADTLEALSRERTWLHEVVDDQRLEKQSLEERARWLAAGLENESAAHAVLEDRISELDREKAELAKQIAWLREGQSASQREVEWLRQSLESKTKEADWLERTVADKGACAEDLEKKLAERTAEVAWLRAQVEAQELRVIAEERRGAEARVRAVDEEKRRTEAEVGRESMARERDWQRGLVAERDRELAWRLETEESLKRAEAHAQAELARVGARLVELEEELRWRRSEMQVVQQVIREKMFPLVSRDLRWRALHWPPGERASREPESTGERASREPGSIGERTSREPESTP